MCSRLNSGIEWEGIMFGTRLFLMGCVELSWISVDVDRALVLCLLVKMPSLLCECGGKDVPLDAFKFKNGLLINFHVV